MQLYLAPVSDDWMPWFNETVNEPVDTAEAPTQHLPKESSVRIWGTTASDRKRSFFEAMESGDMVLFYHDGIFFATGEVGCTVESSDVGTWLWNNPQSRFIYTVEEYQRTSIPVERVNRALGYKSDNVPNGFVRVAEDRVTGLRTTTKSVGDAIDEMASERE